MSSKLSLSLREQTVLDCIPAGHENAISRRRLVRATCLDDRLTREIIYRLVVERGLPIGSSTGPEGGGYFLIEDYEDLEVATRHLKPRARAIFRRAQALERIAREKFCRQLKLVMTE
ncbi:MAG TPA: DNA replication protein [Methanothermobacter sp.]|jgi:hypothetical protein|nr:DNA replication protein [Methanothermobacter sp.]